MTRGPVLLAIGLLSAASAARAQDSDPLPKSLTEAERASLREHPLSPVRGGPTPTGPLWCPPEYAPTQAIMMAWKGSTSWNNILAQMAAQITTIGDADVFMVVENDSVRSNAQNTLQNAGADLSRVRFFTKRLDTIWIRDYGPRFVYEGGVRVIVDHTYNRPRPFDNGLPDFMTGKLGLASYDIPLIHGGGNFHLSGLGDAHATTLILNENPGLGEEEVTGYWRQYQGLDTLIHTAFRQVIDSTQHIDMWMIPVADREIIVSDWPLAPGSFEDNVCDAAASEFAAMGYTVHRVPALATGGTHYTFTNAVLCNDLVCIPSYTNGTAQQYNAQALAVWQQACPGRTVVQIPSQSIVTSAGVLHCIVMHVPMPSGGEDPSVYLRTLNESQTLEPGQQVELQWISDDDIDTYYIKLELSLDGGATWPIIIDTFELDDGTFTWTVPDVATTKGRVKAIVYDWEDRIGDDVNDADFVINGAGSCVADFDGDGAVNSRDVLAFLNEWSSGGADADINGDGVINTLDVTAFLNAWASGC